MVAAYKATLWVLNLCASLIWLYASTCLCETVTISQFAHQIRRERQWVKLTIQLLVDSNGIVTADAHLMLPLSSKRKPLISTSNMYISRHHLFLSRGAVFIYIWWCFSCMDLPCPSRLEELVAECVAFVLQLGLVWSDFLISALHGSAASKTLLRSFGQCRCCDLARKLQLSLKK